VILVRSIRDKRQHRRLKASLEKINQQFGGDL